MIEPLLDILRKSRRSCAVADIRTGRPTDTAPTSSMGGNFFGRPGESWPLNETGPLLPVIQIVTRELPFLPDPLQGIAALAMFIDRKRLPRSGDARNGDGWLLREYGLADDLAPLDPPHALWAGEYPNERRHFRFDKQFRPRTTRLAWRRSDDDYPGWEDFGRLLPHFEWKFDELHPRYNDIAKFQYGTKVGGWPTGIQGGGFGGVNEFVFQIASQEKPRLMWADNGNVYVCRQSSGWHMYWDCY